MVHLVRHDQMKKRFALKKISKHWMDMKQIQQDSPKSTLNKNPFLVGLWCTFSTEVCMNDYTMHGFNTVVKLFFCCSQVHEELANHSSNLLLFFVVFLLT